MERFNVTFDMKVEDYNDFQLQMEDELDADIGIDEMFTGSSDVAQDYNFLKNQPSINGEKLVGDKSAEDLKIVLRGTKDEWDSQPTLVAQKNVIYIYSDYQIEDNGDGTFTIYPGIKIGDGRSYLIDMPFVGGDSVMLHQHISNNIIHVTAEDKEFWNQKWRGYMDDVNKTMLVFTTN